MRKSPFAVCAFLVLLFGTFDAFGTTFYISSSQGSDSNNGTTQSTPWSHAPGMTGCSANCAGHHSTAGDSFIFYGGDTWTVSNAGVFLQISSSGSNGNVIYFGVSQSWYSSSVCGASFCRPIFDVNSVAMNGYAVIDISGTNSYVTIDNLDIRNYRWTGSPPFGTSIINVHSTQNVTLENLYIHAWTHDNPGCSSGTCDLMYAILGDNSQPCNTGDVLTNSEFSGQPSGTDSGLGVYDFPTITNSQFHDMTNGIVSGCSGQVITGNQLYNFHPSYDTGNHQNAIELNGETAALTTIIANNSIHDTGNPVAYTIAVTPQDGATDYIFNNVTYNLPAGGNPIVVQASGASANTSAVYIYNNTLVSNSNEVSIRVAQGGPLGTLISEGNHFITNDTNYVNTGEVCYSPGSGCSVINTKTVTPSTIMSQATATTQGFTVANFFQPTTGATTIGAGQNLAPCNGLMSQLCSATTLGGTISSVPRPANGAGSWNAGAYEFGSGGTAPNPPTALSASVQ